jgi:hypothetical protein
LRSRPRLLRFAFGIGLLLFGSFNKAAAEQLRLDKTAILAAQLLIRLNIRYDDRHSLRS